MATTVVKVAGTDVTALVDFATASFTMQVTGTPGTGSFRVRDIGHDQSFTFGQEVTVDVDGNRLWGGFIVRVQRTFPLSVMAHTTDTRYWLLEVVDYNILFDKRFIRDLSNKQDLFLYAAGTFDDTIVTDIYDHWLDVSGDGLTTDINRVGVAIFDIPGITAGPNTPHHGSAASQGFSWRQAMYSVARNTGAIYFISPTKVFTYIDVDTPSNPWVLTDEPLAVASGVGYRDFSLLDDGTDLRNDALVWGAGLGSPKITFARTTDSTSVTDHGLWQYGDYNTGIYKQTSAATIGQIAVDGSPTSHRGGKDDKVVFQCTTRSPLFTAGQKVQTISNVFGKTEVLPIRAATYTFPTPTDVLTTLKLSYEIDPLWSIFDYWNIAWKFPPFTALRGIVSGIGQPPPECGITDSFPTTVSQTDNADGVTQTGPYMGTSSSGLPWSVMMLNKTSVAVDSGNAAFTVYKRSAAFEFSEIAATIKVNAVPTDFAVNPAFVQFSFDNFPADSDRIQLRFISPKMTSGSVAKLFINTSAGADAFWGSGAIAWLSTPGSGTSIPYTYWHTGITYTLTLSSNGTQMVATVDDGSGGTYSVLAPGTPSTEVDSIGIVAMREESNLSTDASGTVVHFYNVTVPTVNACTAPGMFLNGIVFDIFDRTEISGLGTATDPYVWVQQFNAGNLSTPATVNGYAAVLQDQPKATGGGGHSVGVGYYTGFGGVDWWNDPAGFSLVFMVDIPTNWTLGSYFAIGLDAAGSKSIQLATNGGFPSLGSVSVSTDGDFAADAPFPLTTGWWMFRWDYRNGDNASKLRWWAPGSAEPGSWALTADASTDAIPDRVLLNWQSAASDPTTTVTYDLGLMVNRYEVIDSFKERTASGGWGTSTSSNVWSILSNPGGATISVTGGRGTFSGGGGSPSEMQLTSPGIWGTSTAWEMQTDFVNDGTNAYTMAWVVTNGNGDAEALRVGVNTYAFESFDFVNMNGSSAGFFGALPHGIVNLKWMIDYFSGVSQFKFWAQGGSEPNVWTASEPLSSVPFEQDINSLLSVQFSTGIGSTAGSGPVLFMPANSLPQSVSAGGSPIVGPIAGYVATDTGDHQTYDVGRAYQSGTESVFINGLLKFPITDYTESPALGQIRFNYPLATTDVVTVTFNAIGGTQPPGPPPPANPGSIQALINSASPGATIPVPTGTYSNQTVVVNKANLTLDGQGSILDATNQGFGIDVTATGCTVKNWTVRNAGNPKQTGAVRASLSATGTAFDNIHATNNGGAGIAIGASNCTVTNCESDHNAQEGYICYDLGLSRISNITWTNCHFHHNNPNRAYSSGDEAGGGKAARTSNVTFDGCESDHNNGPGIWYDIDNDGMEIKNCKLHHNEQGYFIEISSGGLVHNNAVWENGWINGTQNWGWPAGGMVSSSSNVQVYSNTFGWNDIGMSVLSQARGSGLYNWDVIHDVYVHDNIVVATDISGIPSGLRMLNWLQDHPGTLFSDSTNRGLNNQFYSLLAEPSGTRFYWNNTGYSTASSFAGTQGGNGSTNISSGTALAALVAAGIPTVPEHS